MIRVHHPKLPHTTDIDSIPTVADLLLVRHQPYDEAPEGIQNAFLWMAENIMQDVAGRKNWNCQVKSKGLMRNCVTVSDEAFAILLLDNNMEKWREQVEEKEDQENQNGGGKTVTTKYTASGRMWSRKGMSRFVEIYNVVSEGRAADKNRTTTWDAKLREMWKAEILGKKPQGNRRKTPMTEPSFIEMPIDAIEEV
jgi:putative NIF3 family GTP cyclohydrolase 1 type 2